MQIDRQDEKSPEGRNKRLLWNKNTFCIVLSDQPTDLPGVLISEKKRFYLLQSIILLKYLLILVFISIHQPELY